MIEKIKNRYNIISEIGSGGMADIYSAIDLLDNKKVALKVLSPEQKENIIHKKRFLSEIKIMKMICSPYVVKIYEGVWENDIQYISMELIEGHILKNLINKNGRLVVDEVVDFSKQLALGFAEIHNCGIIHRDIKSQNIMVDKYGTIKIIDFGIALTNESEMLTRADSIIGSVQYIAPELVLQEKATPQSDIYALGVLMFEMLVGYVPFKGKDAYETLMKHKDLEIPFVNSIIENIPNSLTNIIAKCVNKDPLKRYKNMHELFNDLDTSLNKERILEPIKTKDNKKNRNIFQIINSKKFIISSIIIGLLLLIIIVVVGLTI